MLKAIKCQSRSTSLFMTITNANFDDTAIENQIEKMIAIRDQLRNENPSADYICNLSGIR